MYFICIVDIGGVFDFIWDIEECGLYEEYMEGFDYVWRLDIDDGVVEFEGMDL